MAKIALEETYATDTEADIEDIMEKVLGNEERKEAEESDSDLWFREIIKLCSYLSTRSVSL